MVTTAELKKLIKARPEVPSDNYVCPLITRFYSKLPYEGRVVMDAGGNIGAFAVYAALRGAKFVYTYEPEEENFALLKENIKPYPNIVAFKAALTNSRDDFISFYLTNGESTDGYSTIQFNGRRKITVSNMNFMDELERTQPSVIKMNIEGGEYELMENILPSFVTDIVMDIHFSKRYFREQFPQLISQFSTWKTIIEPKDTGKNFHTKGQWTR